MPKGIEILSQPHCAHLLKQGNNKNQAPIFEYGIGKQEVMPPLMQALWQRQSFPNGVSLGFDAHRLWQHGLVTTLLGFPCQLMAHNGYFWP